MREIGSEKNVPRKKRVSPKTCKPATKVTVVRLWKIANCMQHIENVSWCQPYNALRMLVGASNATQRNAFQLIAFGTSHATQCSIRASVLSVSFKFETNLSDSDNARGVVFEITHLRFFRRNLIARGVGRATAESAIFPHLRVGLGNAFASGREVQSCRARNVREHGAGGDFTT